MTNIPTELEYKIKKIEEVLAEEKHWLSKDYIAGLERALDLLNEIP
jgi:hypothetical protein